MTPNAPTTHAEALEAARRELEEAEKRLEHHTITEADLIRRNRAKRIVNELEREQEGGMKR